MPGPPGRTGGGQGEARDAARRGEVGAAGNGPDGAGTCALMEAVVHPDNLRSALKRVRQNKGSPGIDGMTVDQLGDHLRARWPQLREDLLAGRYQPQPVRRCEIPKTGGGTRMLGIPTVLDRFIQQALLQVLQPRFDPTFSPHSYGFRPGRRAHDAVQAAQRFIVQGRTWVVDIDLEKFFDRICHDKLMAKLAARIVDRRVLGLIRRYLEAGMLADGVVIERHAGAPQGGPLSPLVANVFLDDVDKVLEHRGHAFVRYADDCNVYVQSQRAAERVMHHLRMLYAGLHLRINDAKSAVARAWERTFLGFGFTRPRDGQVKRTLAAKTQTAFKERVRRMTRRSCGRSMAQVVAPLAAYLRGWKQYFGFVETPSTLRHLEEWLRHRLRALHLKQWRRGPTIFRELRARGLSELDARRVAANARRWWRNSAKLLNKALPLAYFDGLGLPRLVT